MTRKYKRNANSSTKEFVEKEIHVIIYILAKTAKSIVKEEDALKESRHPYHCQYWQKGNCFRREECLFLHSDILEHKECNDNDETSDDANYEISDEINDEISYETTHKPLSTEEICKLYENRSSLDDTTHEQLSAEEIIRLYENEEDEEETFTDVNEDNLCTDDLIQLYKYKMTNKNQRNDVDIGLRKSTSKSNRN